MIYGLALYHQKIYSSMVKNQLEIQKTEDTDKIRQKWGGYREFYCGCYIILLWKLLYKKT